MMKRICSILALVLAAGISFSFAQKIDDNSVLVVVGNDTTTRGEFMRIYSQNLSGQASENPSRAELQTYLSLYVHFRMKVLDAREAGYDTVQAIQEELHAYSSQLAKPYVMDTKVMEQLEKESLENLQYDICARQIRVAMPLYPTPEDTLEAYRKIVEAREKLMKGEDFGEVALEYSDEIRTDRHGRKIRTGREGLMGYFTTTQVYYLLEQALYSMKVGEISQPIRTKYGYHVVQLLDKKPTLGKVTISHILVPVFSRDSAMEALAKARIDSAYEMLISGYDFGEVAMKYSADQQSVARGGKLGTMSVNRITAEEASVLYTLREGEFSKPFRGRYGWQIVQLDAKTGMPNHIDALALVRYNIETGLDRGHLPYEAFVEKKLKTAHWKWDEKVIKEVQEYLRGLGSLRKLPRQAPENDPFFHKTVLRFEDFNYSVWDFLSLIIKETPSDDKVNNQVNWFNAMRKEALTDAALRHEYTILEKKHPDYAKQMNEYRDGVYLFEISNRKVWSKALTDTAGLEEYFEAHRDKYICPAKAKAKVMMYDVSMVDTRDVEKLAQKAYDKKMNQREIQMMFDKKYKGNRLVKVDSAAYAPGENVFVDNTAWTVGFTKNIMSGTSRKAYVIIDELVPSRPYELSEVSGVVMNDYQGYLDWKWIEELHGKYRTKVNEEVFNTLFKK